jgi:hypothetical protein
MYTKYIRRYSHFYEQNIYNSLKKTLFKYAQELYPEDANAQKM